MRNTSVGVFVVARHDSISATIASGVIFVGAMIRYSVGSGVSKPARSLMIAGVFVPGGVTIESVPRKLRLAKSWLANYCVRGERQGKDSNLKGR